MRKRGGFAFIVGAVNESTSLGSPSPARELSRRSNGGITVVLLWHEVTGALIVCVSDDREGAYFELHPPPELALDAFNHPYAHVDRADPYLVDERLVDERLAAEVVAPTGEVTT